MATVAAPLEKASAFAPKQHFALNGVDWANYRKISEAFGGRHMRMTYDRGYLEFMTKSSTHGVCSRLLARLVQTLSEELGVPILSVGDMTCDREDLDRGAEPDEGFYFANAARVRERDPIDLEVDPPPDLMIEIDISRSSARRLMIYAGLGVPEVWQCDGERLTIHRAAGAGSFVVAGASQWFPGFPVHELAVFVQRRTEVEESALIAEFRAWVRRQRATTSNP
jgi:Uma2 family endonuclease